MTGYRIHSADEDLEALLDPRRPDGWIADDESAETQPYGVSCCLSLRDLARYVRHYSLAPQPGDLLVRLDGDLGDDDRDQHAARLVVDRYEVIGTASEFLAAMQAAAADPRYYDDDDLGDLLGEYDSSTARRWVAEIR
jgi:hypothetical protein